MKKLIAKIREQFDSSDIQGDPLEDLGKLFMFIAIVFGLGILTLVIELIIWLINNI
jgi:hypothetical protein